MPGNTKVCKGVLGSAEEYETVFWRPGGALECQGVLESNREYHSVPRSKWKCLGMPGSAKECKRVSGISKEYLGKDCQIVLRIVLECKGVRGSVMEYFGVPVSAKSLSNCVGMCMEVLRSANKSQRVPVRTRECQGIPGNI